MFFHGWIHSGFVSEHEGEWECLGGMMRGSVVLEFSRRKEVWPTLRVVGTKYPKIGFDLLVGPLSLSVSL